MSYVSFFGDVLMFFAWRTYDNKKTYIRGWREGWIIGEKLRMPTPPCHSHERRGTFYHKRGNILTKTGINSPLCQLFQGEYSQCTDTQLEIRMDENIFSYGRIFIFIRTNFYFRPYHFWRCRWYLHGSIRGDEECLYFSCYLLQYFTMLVCVRGVFP